MITRVQYFQVATVLPVLAPFPLAATLIGSGLLRIQLPVWFGNVAILAAMGMFLFAPLYAVLMAVILFALRRKNWQAHAAAALLAPWLMAAAVGVSQATIDREVSIRAAMRVWAEPCLRLGYGYVAITFVGLPLAERLGWIKGGAGR